MFYKFTYLIILSFLFSLPLASQELSWTTLGNQWRYDLPLAGGSSHQLDNATLTADRDTTINDSLKCTILKATTTSYFNKRDIIIYVDANDKDVVYQYADGAFWKLYDFGMAVGEEMDVYLPEMAAFGVTNPFLTVRVDSISTRSIGNQEVRAQFITDVAGPSFGFRGWNYEFLGNQEYYFVPINLMDCEGACPSGQLCFDSPVAGVEVALSADRPCDSTFVSTNIVDVSERLLVYPVPSRANGVLTLEGPSNVAGPVTIRIANQLGQIVDQQKLVRFPGRAELRLKNLPDGVYYLNWESSGARGGKKIVISNG